MIRTSQKATTGAVLLGLAGVMLAIAAPAAAEPGYSSTRVGVATQDIDLSSPADVEKLHRRVASAIRLACAADEFGGAPSFGRQEQASAENACLVNANAAAAPQLQKLIARGNAKMASF